MDFQIAQPSSGSPYTITWPSGWAIYGQLNPNLSQSTYARVIFNPNDAFGIVVYQQTAFEQFVAYQETQTSVGGSGTLSLNLNTGTVFTVTATANITINSSGISNAAAGRSFTVIITQGGSGNNTLTSNFKFAGGNNVLSTAVGAIDIMNVYFDGTNYYASLNNGYV
jgi:hypothetical protein